MASIASAAAAAAAATGAAGVTRTTRNVAVNGRAAGHQTLSPLATLKLQI